ncbi:MAG: SGNH/GDSL hydrolase family protein [Balneolaceae bacterium]
MGKSSARASEGEKEALEKYLFQFLNLEKQFPLLPGIRNPEALASIMGVDRSDVEKWRVRYQENARQAASELLQEEEISEAIDQLPFRDGETIIALGDSMTDDLQGWFQIFQELVRLARPEDEYHWVNSGASYNTTSEALRRLHRDVLSRNPDWVFVSLGTFDGQRLSFAPDRTLIPLSETWENLNIIQSAIGTVTENPVFWISPPPVIDGMLDQMDLFDFRIDASDLLQIREIIASKSGHLVDPAGLRMGNPPEAWYYLSDGLHPSLSGHTNTVRELVLSFQSSSDD